MFSYRFSKAPRRYIDEEQKTLPPLVAHIIHRLAMGGLENGLVNLINHMPLGRYRHAIVCLTDYTDFRKRLIDPNIPVIALNKSPGRDLGVHLRLRRTLRYLRPHIVHTRNLSTLEFQIMAAVAGCRNRIHGEHGRDMYDLDGTNIKYNLLRRGVRPIIHRYVAVSQDLAGWLVKTVGVDGRRLTRIYNGVDACRFRPRSGQNVFPGPHDFITPETFVVGTVGRMEPVKDQLTLVRAFLHLLEAEPRARKNVRLVMVGDGQLWEHARRLLYYANAEKLVWLPGERSDIPEIMRSLDLFVLPSLREGISNTVLEAMATGLPVVATKVGGNSELVDENTGILVPPSNPVAMAEAIWRYILDCGRAKRHGMEGRNRVEARFSMQSMVAGYLRVYDSVLRGKEDCPDKLTDELSGYGPEASA